MRAFVIRAFGQRAGVDFDQVHDELIAPALRELNIEGGTTGEIVEAGNIREDMYRELVLADLVIADVSVHNANVFYELGIRHAVQDRATVLIRARIDRVPFDLQTDRYLAYEPGNAAASVPGLVEVLRDTLNSERADSPVFQLLPGYTASPHTDLARVPRELAEAIEQAGAAERKGDLRLIAEEVVGLRCEAPALTMVAEALARAGDRDGAQRVWELIRTAHPDDLKANRALSDIYRRLDRWAESDQAIGRVIRSRALSSEDRAELYALQGSNSKRLWVKRWQEADEPDRARIALQSQELYTSFESYRRGFDEQLNHWYSGLNALALATIMLELAGRCPDAWRYRFESDDAADQELTRLQSEAGQLTATVRSSLDSHRRRSRRATADVWLEISTADLRFLTCDAPERVASAYRAALSKLVDENARRSVREQLQMFDDLGILRANAEAALAVVGPAPANPPGKHPVVFTGHMIDEPGRPSPRFPADQEEKARTEIRKAVRDLVHTARERGEEPVGISGAADGGDLLFLEVCHELGVPTQILLPVPELAYRVTAMPRQTSRWPDRYHAALRNAQEVRILSRTGTLPSWLPSRRSYSAWQRSNRWLMHHAWTLTTIGRVSVLALWDGQPGAGPGGVADLVTYAQTQGAEVHLLNTTAIFGLPGREPAASRPADRPEPVAAVTAAPGDQAGPAAPSGHAHDDELLQLAWRSQGQWSRAADAAQSRLNRSRTLNLTLLVLGAIAAAIATQTGVALAGKTSAAIVSAVALAIAGVIQGSSLTRDKSKRWTDARAASEALKAEVYRYLARVKPYAGLNRADRLRHQLNAIQERAKNLAADQQLAGAGHHPLPDVSTFQGYLTERAKEQADWHRNRGKEHGRTARTLRFGQFAATIAGAVLAAVAGAVPALHLAAWTAAATTVAAAVATHIAATQHQRLANSFAATASRLDTLIAGAAVDSSTPDQRARFVADVERVLAAQNDGWVDLISAAADPDSAASA